jgi:hypothetical protein
VRCFPIILLASLFCEVVLAQPQRSPAVIRHLVPRSGFIFAGTVISFEKPSGTVPTVRVTFKIDRGIRGVRTGQTFSIREWAGLWDRTPRYRARQRVFLFLYPPSKLGLTSPVNGAGGRFRIDEGGAVVIDGSPAVGSPRLQGKPMSTPARMSVPQFVGAIRRVEED